jgi:hypothetical protein
LELPSNSTLLAERLELRRQITAVTPATFEQTALRVFRYQARHNPVYRSYLSHLRVRPEAPQRLTEIPFLPIQLFRNHAVHSEVLAAGQATEVFESSGTTGSVTSRHLLFDAPLYQQVCERIFEDFYGPLSNYHILALLPSYLERNNSSLVYMARHFIEKSGSPYSGFYLHDTDALTRQLHTLARPGHPASGSGRRVLLLGVTFALLDWAEQLPEPAPFGDWPELVVMETGGMKGRRREMLREEVHEVLTSRLGVEAIHSEYGMTELLSQGYSLGHGLFRSGYTMRVLLRDTNDPFDLKSEGTFQRTGGINVVDLANLDSCSFIETQDLGRLGPEEGTFYVMGRFDNADVRGCNLMVL